MIPKRRTEDRGLFRTGDGQTAGRRDGQSLFKDAAEGGGRGRRRKRKEEEGRERSEPLNDMRDEVR